MFHYEVGVYDDSTYIHKWICWGRFTDGQLAMRVARKLFYKRQKYDKFIYCIRRGGGTIYHLDYILCSFEDRKEYLKHPEQL